MEKLLQILQTIKSTFLQDTNKNILNESVIKSIEHEKISILSELSKMSPTAPMKNEILKTAMQVITTLFNHCLVVQTVTGFSDEKNNFILLRIKNFVLELFFAIFPILDQRSLKDLVLLIKIVNDVGYSLLQYKMESKGTFIIDQLASLLDAVLNQVKRFSEYISNDESAYTNFFSFLCLYFDFCILNEDPKVNPLLDLKRVLLIVTNIKLKDKPETNNLFVKISSALPRVKEVNQQIQLFELISNTNNKEKISKDILLAIYKAYADYLISNSMTAKADKLINDSLSMTQRDSKEEIEFFIIKLYSMLQNREEKSKIKEMLELIFEHSELSIELLENIIIRVGKCSFNDCFFEIFLNKIKQKKSYKYNNKISFSQEIIKKYPRFTIMFFVNFFKSIPLINDITSLQSPILIDLLKSLSESLLENTVNHEYNTEDSNYEYLIPSLFHNIITYFLNNDDNTNVSFANYFLLEIIKQLKNTEFTFWKEFFSESIEIYIQKKDYPKLKAILEEIESSNDKERFDSVYYFGKVNLLLGSGMKFNTVTNVNALCAEINESDKCDMDIYLKILSSAYNMNIQDVALFSLLMYNMVKKFNICLKNNKINPNHFIANKNECISLFDCFRELLFYTSRMNGFETQINSFSEIFDELSDIIELKKFDYSEGSNDRYISADITLITEVIKMMIDLKNNLKLNDSFPEYILISINKMLSCVFVNFDKFIDELLVNTSQERILSDILPKLISLFQLFHNLKIFSFSFEYESNDNEENYPKLYQRFCHYSDSFANAVKLTKNRLSQYANAWSTIESQLDTVESNSKIVNMTIYAHLKMKVSSPEEITNYVFDIMEKECANKKLILLINSILFQNGYIDISIEYLKKLLNYICSIKVTDLYIKVYSLEDVLMIFKDLINLEDNTHIEDKVFSLFQFSSYLIKIIGKIDNEIIENNLQWIYSKEYDLLESGQVIIEPTNIIFQRIKSIFEDWNQLGLKNINMVTKTLMEMVAKKIIL